MRSVYYEQCCPGKGELLLGATTIGGESTIRQLGEVTGPLDHGISRVDFARALLGEVPHVFRQAFGGQTVGMMVANEVAVGAFELSVARARGNAECGVSIVERLRLRRGRGSC